jgi:hypothetical protein
MVTGTHNVITNDKNRTMCILSYEIINLSVTNYLNGPLAHFAKKILLGLK